MENVMKFQRFDYSNHSQISEMISNYLLTISNVNELAELTISEINEFLNDQQDWYFQDIKA